MCANFQTKRTTLTFLAQICQKRHLELEIQKTNFEIRMSILEIPWVPIFRQNGQIWLFGSKFAQKWNLGSEFQKINVGIRISILEIPCVPTFRQNGQLCIFRSKFGEIVQFYVRYFSSNIVEGVAESWVEAEMSWVEVDGARWRLKWAGWRWMGLGGDGWSWVEVGARFSNTQLKTF